MVTNFYALTCPTGIRYFSGEQICKEEAQKEHTLRGGKEKLIWEIEDGGIRSLDEMKLSAYHIKLIRTER